MRRSSEVKGVYDGLTLTFVLGRTSGFASGLGLATEIETGNDGEIAGTTVTVFPAGFAMTIVVFFLATGFTLTFEVSFLFRVTGFTITFAAVFLFLITGFTTFFCFTLFDFLFIIFFAFAFDFLVAIF